MIRAFWPGKAVPNWLEEIEITNNTRPWSAKHHGFGVIWRVHGFYIVWLIAGLFIKIDCGGGAVSISAGGRGVSVHWNLKSALRDIRRVKNYAKRYE